MSKGNKEEQKWLLGESLNQYDRSLKEELNKVEKRNREQNHKISALINAFDDDYIKKEEENTNISLDYSKEGIVIVDDIKGNTLVNNIKDSNKELVLNGDIDTSGYGNVTITEGVDGGKVDIALEGNTMVNVCDQEDPIAITKNYEVTTGNHIALQGEYDGKCRPNIYGNTLVNIITSFNFVTGSGTDKFDYLTGSYKDIGDGTGRHLGYSVVAKPNTLYTVLANIKINTLDNKFGLIGWGITKNNTQVTVPNGFTGQFISTFTTTNEKLSNLWSTDIWKENTTGTIELDGFMILEGDYTNKPIPDYFTGMKSSFEDKLVPENLYKFSSRDDFYALDNNVTLDGEYIKMTANGKYQNAALKPLDTIKPSTTYTIVTDVIENTLDSRLVITTNTNDAQLPSAQPTIVNAGKTGIFTQLVTTGNDLSGCIRCLVNFLDIANTTGSIKYRIMVVEGDYTNYDFTDYDSTKGGKYKVDFKVTGKNKFDFNKLNSTSYGQPNLNVVWDRINQQYTISGSTSRQYVTVGEYYDTDTFKHGKTYTVKNYISNNDTVIQFVISYKHPITGKDTYIVSRLGKNTFTYDKSWGAMHVYCQIDNILDNISPFTLKFQIEEGTKTTTYESYKEYTKTLYLNTPLLEGDTIEQSGNDIVHVHRYNKVVLDGSNYVPARGGTFNSAKYRWVLYKNDNILKFTGDPNILINDRYPLSTPIGTWGSDNNYIEGITINSQDSSLLLYLDKYKDGSDDSKTLLIKELQANPITVAYELATPTQEIISTNDNLLLDSYVNGHLDVDSIVPIDKVVFQSYGTGLKYLSPNTEYTIQFESDNNGKLDALALNSSDVIGNLNIVKGINKFNITTSDKITINYLWTTGIGFNMSKVVVTPKVDGDFGYFKGMKSVGQDDVDGHKIEILSSKNITPSSHVKYTNHGIEFNFGSKTINENVYVHNISNKRVMVHTSINGKYSNGFMIVKNSKKLIELKEGEVIYCASVNYADGWNDSDVEKARNSFIITKKENELNKKEILMNEPLRGLPNGVRDKYVMIDGKWFIQRNCGEVKGSDGWYKNNVKPGTNGSRFKLNVNNFKKIRFIEVVCNLLSQQQKTSYVNQGTYICTDEIDQYGVLCIRLAEDIEESEFRTKYSNLSVIYPLATPTYEPIDCNPFEVYTDITHISNNSIIPCNMVIKNTGYNCILKPNTKYTVVTNTQNSISAKIGSTKVDSTNNVFTIITPSTLTDSVLRFSGKGLTTKDIMLLEGDKTNYIPGYFTGMESVFEQELITDEKDKNYGKYKVNAKVIGKNLFNKDTVIIGKYQNCNINTNNFDISDNPNYNITDFVSVKPNTQYTISGTDIKYHAYYDKNKKPITTIASISTSFTTPGNAYYMVFNLNSTDNLNEVQIEQGTTATEYEPYKENNITFYLKEPLRGVGDVKDKVYVKEDKIVVERNYTGVTFDGSDDEKWFKDTLTNNYTDGSFIATYRTSNMKPNTQVSVGGVVDNLPNLSMNMNIYSSKTLNMNCYSSGWSQHYICLKNVSTIDEVKQWLQANPTTVVYQLATPIYKEVECDLSKLMLENYENSSLILNSNIPPTVNVRYKGELPIVSATKELSSSVEFTTTDINQNIIPYMCDMDYRIVELQLKNASTQGLEVNVLGLDSENVLLNNRKANKIFNPSYEMLKRDILSERYSSDEYKYRLERYLLADKISNEEYNELEELINGR